MKHQLPKIEDIIEKDFIFTDEKMDDILCHFKLVNEQLMFFERDVNDLVCLDIRTIKDLSQYHVPINAMPWRKAVVIDMLDSWSTIHHKANDVDTLLFYNRDKPVGFVKAKTLFRFVLNAYNYLHAYHDTIVETMEESVTVIDENHNTVVWTSGAEKIFSIEKEDIIGKPMTEFFPEKMLENLKTLHTGQSVYRKQHQPREDLIVLINTNPVKIDDNIVGVVVAETDVTFQIQLNEQLTHANNEINHLRHEVSRMHPAYDPFSSIKGSSPAIKKTIDKIKQVGSTEARVLFLGESGVGKELFAKALHDFREKRNAPFIAVNCGAIPPSLFESELFGYEKGAFSGADAKGRKGKIELAQGGTFFLDEVGEIPLDIQVKLLRVLQENNYYRVGGTKQIQADCRVIAATNKDLEQLVKEGKFRDDLYYRLNIVSIPIPLLRDRIEDVVELSHLFLYEYATKYNRKVTEIPKVIMHGLLNHTWPGNIRELRNTIERLVVFSKNGSLDKDDLPFLTENRDLPITINLEANSPTVQTKTLKESLYLKEKEIIEQAVNNADGNKITTAKQLGISRATLYNKMNKLGIRD